MNIDCLPFFFKSHISPNNGGFPEYLPFDLYFDEKFRMFRQKITPELGDVLIEVYKLGSLVEGSVSSESGKIYISKVIDFLYQHFEFDKNTKILEIGFGSGILLKELKQRGINNLTGIEPGDHKLVEGLTGIKLIKDFFPSAQFKDKVDLIFSFGILEHIENPLSFINDQINQLTENGKIIFCVPNCEPYLSNGDPSIFIHEHFSYFTTESIIRLVNKSGFRIESISIIEGAFIVAIKRTGVKPVFLGELFSETEFQRKFFRHTEKVNTVLSKFKQSEIAIYAPVRACNSLFITQKTEVRLVDDNAELHRKYLPALQSKIESFDELINNPPRLLLIFSRTFGERLKNKCVKYDKLASTIILTLSDLDNLED